MATPPFVLLLSDDLLDASRVAGHARAAGLELVTTRTPDRLLALAAERPPAGIILDLHNPGLDVSGVRAAVPGVRVVAYGSHVDAARLRAAREAGCDRVMPRSRFVEELPGIAGWFAPGGDDA